MKNKKIIDNTELFKQRADRKQELQAQRDRRDALLGARKIWEDWHKHVVIQSRKIEDLPKLLNELAGQLESELKDADIRKSIVELVQTKLIDIYGRIEIEKKIVRVLMDCPTDLCEWGGMAYFDRTQYEAGTVTFECPTCKHQLTKVDMALPEELKGPQVNRICKYVKSRVQKGKPPKPYEFMGKEQLLALPFVVSAMKEKGFEKLFLDGNYLMAEHSNHPNIPVGCIEFPERVEL